MELTSVVARFYRAGGENSSWLGKLRFSLDELVNHIASVLELRGGERKLLPDGIELRYWPSTEYELTGRLGDKDFKLTHNSKSRLDILLFSDIVAQGWVDHLSDMLEAQTIAFKQTHSALRDVERELKARTHAVQYQPNCPSPYLVRLVGKKSSVIDYKLPAETNDILGYGQTLEEAATKALDQL